MTCVRLVLTDEVAEKIRHRLHDSILYDLPEEMQPTVVGRVLLCPAYPETIEATGKFLPPRYRLRLRDPGYERASQNAS